MARMQDQARFYVSLTFVDNLLDLLFPAVDCLVFVGPTDDFRFALPTPFLAEGSLEGVPLFKSLLFTETGFSSASAGSSFTAAFSEL